LVSLSADAAQISEQLISAQAKSILVFPCSCALGLPVLLIMIPYLTIPFAVRSISSPALIAREFISYARWALMRLTSSVTI
jgi:hypothetical protein